MKATTAEIELVQRLSNTPADPVALSELFGYCYEPIIDALKKKFPKGDQDDIYEIAFQTVDQFAKSPQRFDSEKNSLTGYVVMDAIGDMLNLISKKSRKKKLTFLVEDWDAHGNNLVGETSNKDIEEIALGNFESRLRDLFPNDIDFEFARMMELGIRDTDQYVKLINVENESIEEQRTIVKRHKDRIGKQMERNNWKDVKKKIRDQLL